MQAQIDNKNIYTQWKIKKRNKTKSKLAAIIIVNFNICSYKTNKKITNNRINNINNNVVKMSLNTQGQATKDDTNSFVNVAFTHDENGGVIRRKSGNSNGLQLDATNATGASNNAPPIDFDDILPMIGEFGKYQKILFLCMIPFAFFVAFIYFSQIFLTLVPEQHWCSVPELDSLPLEER